MNISEFVHKALKEYMEINKLTESQSKFINLFDTGFKMGIDPFFKQIMVVLNRIDFNTRWSLKQQDIFMQHLKVPQTMDELNVSFLSHPITEKAEQMVLKDLRKMKDKKKEIEDE